jgi:hypothetical protein
MADETWKGENPERQRGEGEKWAPGERRGDKSTYRKPNVRETEERGRPVVMRGGGRVEPKGRLEERTGAEADRGQRSGLRTASVS